MSETQGNPSDAHSHAPAGPPEPKTPMWLPALGAVLFLAAGLLWGLMPAATDSASDAPAEGASGAGDARDAGAPTKR
jgi:hypothetical protein